MTLQNLKRHILYSFSFDKEMIDTK